MFQVAYSIFFVVLAIQVATYLLLNLPTPQGWKSKIVRFIHSNQTIKYMMKGQIAICLIAALFLIDSYRTEIRLKQEKQAVNLKDSYASELKFNYLSFLGMKAQRNEFITFMVIYTSVALTMFLKVLNYLYEMREKRLQNNKQSEAKQVQKQEPVKNE